MDAFLDRLESEFSEFVSRISHFEPVAEFPVRFEQLDRDLVTEIAELRRHYAACRRIDELKEEASPLDMKVNGILIELAQFREELEGLAPAPAPSGTPVNSGELLELASKITRFTKQLPGSAETGILPWPAEDQLRRGMLATLTIQEESLASGEPSGADNYTREATEVSSVAESSAAESAAGPEMRPQAASEPRMAGERAPRSKPASKPKISLDFDSDED